MRRILWNIYAWPITLILVFALFPVRDRIGVLPTFDLMLSLPAIAALNLYIWDKKTLSQNFWKPYAFGFLAWELFYNLYLEPGHSGEPFEPILLIVPVILIPFYIALFKYAYRKWNEINDKDINRP